MVLVLAYKHSGLGVSFEHVAFIVWFLLCYHVQVCCAMVTK